MHKISYLKKWNSEGTCFRQTITITEKEFKEVMIYLNGIVLRDIIADAYLHNDSEFKDGIYYANLTQRDQICFLLGIYTEKRYRNENTCFKVVKK